ncbi:hypothetical protein SynSYN20_01602 [Synechococcus sp. SYN20]|uniref:hypothetical protein n=1 Tax=Synechococcus sp. SYN20 TaxID=1050714 RepID=UPI001645E184|nr:hypothetical protein [Synechococcus sp. SYN20]QNJ25929.1 hypothetical protein SynSYN20_01602 [Synechococcus sp. SYN20]
MTNIATIRTAAYQIAVDFEATKSQAMSLAILAINAAGFTAKEAFEAVIGEGRWDMLPADCTEEAVMAAVFADIPLELQQAMAAAA